MTEEWSDEHFLGYVEIHSKTELALFSGDHVRRFFKLAGVEPPPVRDETFYPMPWYEFEGIYDAAMRRLEASRKVSQSAVGGSVSMEEKVVTLEAEVARLKELLHRDKTGLSEGLDRVREIAKGFDWICEGRGPYAYDDDRYRMEVGSLVTRVIETAERHLHASGMLVQEAFHPRAKETARMLAEDCAAEGLVVSRVGGALLLRPEESR